MADTGMCYAAPLLPKRAAGYRRTFAGYENARHLAATAAGGLYSTVDDLLRWDRALYSDRLLSRQLRDRMFTPTGHPVAYGWKVAKAEGGRVVIRQTGAQPGFNCLLVRQPEHRRTVILLTNTREMTWRLDDIASAVSHILDGNPYEMPKRSLAEELYETFARQGPEAGRRRFHDLRGREAGAWYTSETEMNALGYALLNLGKTREAVEALKLNVETYPDSWNAYDSLGEAYTRHGDKEPAWANYRKSLELNPENTNAREMLRKLQE
jgi:tetratricopeptide (TPR) repeat protein